MIGATAHYAHWAYPGSAFSAVVCRASVTYMHELERNVASIEAGASTLVGALYT